jgi:hypothetical protein
MTVVKMEGAEIAIARRAGYRRVQIKDFAM